MTGERGDSPHAVRKTIFALPRFGAHLPRKPNYNFEKQRKEQNRQAKKDAKREEKLRRKQQEELQRPPEPSPETQ